MNRKYADRNTRKLTRLGGHSLGLTLPVELVWAMGWKEHQKVKVAKRGRSLVIHNWKK